MFEAILDVSFEVFFFFFKQKTAYDMRISDWSSDVCSSDLTGPLPGERSRGPRRAVGFRRTYGRGRATARPDAGHPQLVANLLDDPAYPQSHLARQHFELIFRRPDDMVAMAKSRVITLAVAHSASRTLKPLID